MLNAFSILLGCEIGGEILRRIFSLPLPGAVIGMCFLALFLLRKPPHSRKLGFDRRGTPYDCDQLQEILVGTIVWK
jgi:hypothetical protein